jgi:hypothetical protein
VIDAKIRVFEQYPQIPVIRWRLGERDKSTLCRRCDNEIRKEIDRFNAIRRDAVSYGAGRNGGGGQKISP